MPPEVGQYYWIRYEGEWHIGQFEYSSPAGYWFFLAGNEVEEKIPQEDIGPIIEKPPS